MIKNGLFLKNYINTILVFKKIREKVSSAFNLQFNLESFNNDCSI